MTEETMSNIPYNAKVNTDGTYRSFNGYTTISMLKDDLSSIEKFIADSEILSKYYAPLPSSSYHMTVFNVWCQKQKELPMFRKFLDEQEKALEERKILREAKQQSWEYMANGYYHGSDAYYLKYPERKRKKEEVCNYVVPLSGRGPIFRKDFWIHVMLKIDEYINLGVGYVKEFNTNVLTRDDCIKRGVLSVGIILDKETSDILTDLRNKISKHVGHGDDGLIPHMTLAYRYKDIPESEIEYVNKEVERMNKHITEVSKNGITFYKPFASWFPDMTEFASHKDLSDLFFF